jgi:exodeoxyribonuclease VII small subunit
MAKSETPSDVPFEDALLRIQEIVQQLEQGSLGLEESLGQFEQGVKLIRTCHQTLERAEQRIQILTGVDADGQPVLADFDATATIDENKKTAGRRKKPSKPSEGDESEGFGLF